MHYGFAYHHLKIFYHKPMLWNIILLLFHFKARPNFQKSHTHTKIDPIPLSLKNEIKTTKKY